MGLPHTFWAVAVFVGMSLLTYRVTSYAFKAPSLYCADDPVEKGCCEERDAKAQGTTIPREAASKKLLIGIGCAKCGSTYMYGLLMRHPRFQRAIRKELHFFGTRTFTPEKASEYYANWNFRKWQDGSVATEFTPYYMWDPAVPCQVKLTAPHAKFLVVLREPAARLYSWQNYQRKFCKSRPCNKPGLMEEDVFAPLSFLLMKNFHVLSRNCSRIYEDGLTWQDYMSPECLDTKLMVGMYARQLAWWLEFFPPERFLIISAYDLWKNPVEITNRVVEFMGLEEEFTPKMLGKRGPTHWSAPYNMYDAGIDRTMEYLREFYAPFDRDLYELMDEIGTDFPKFEIEEVENGEDSASDDRAALVQQASFVAAAAVEQQRCATEITTLQGKELRMRRGLIFVTLVSGALIATYVVTRAYGNH